MTWSIVNFGKHKGKTLPQIVLTDPDWFFWAVENEAFNAALKAEADDILRKATRIRIPDLGGSKSKVQYVLQPGSGKLAEVQVVPAHQPAHEGASSTILRDYFDLSVPRQISSYDKAGGQIIVRAIKLFVFGNVSAQLTKSVCEKFFADDINFA